jgi:hypothetical protein
MPWRDNNELPGKTVDSSNAYVNETGDKMRGVLDMNLNKIINIPTPVNPDDVANRDYVDITSRNMRIFVKNYYPQVYGFRLEKTVSSTDYQTTVVIIVPRGVSPNRIFFHTFHPLIRAIDYRVITESGTHTTSKALYVLQFYIPAASAPYVLITEGLIYVLPFEITSISGKSITVSLETERPTVSVNEADGDSESTE